MTKCNYLVSLRKLSIVCLEEILHFLSMIATKKKPKYNRKKKRFPPACFPTKKYNFDGFDGTITMKYNFDCFK